MDTERYKFRYNAYKNNTFNLRVVEDTLQESKMSAYKYLREFQLDSTGYKRFDFKMQEIYKTNNVNHNSVLLPRRWVFFIEHEFINVGKRLMYKRSKLYEKELSFNEINKRPDLFDSSFLLFIEGRLYTKGVKLLCKEDKTYIILNCCEVPTDEGFSIDEMKRYIEENVNVTLYIIPNTGIKSISTNAYRLRTLNKTTGIPERVIGLNDGVDYNNALAYITHVNNIESIPTSFVMKDGGLYVNERTIDYVLTKYPDNSAVDLQVIPLRNLLFKLHNEKGNAWFEIPMQDYPVAIDNCLVVDSDGIYLHEAKIRHHYPNIYHIEGVDDIINKKDIFIYVFYYENKLNQLKHLDMLASYHKYVPDYLERYKNNDIPDLIKNFNPKMVEYSIKDYQKNINLSEDIPGVYIKNEKGEVYLISVSNYQLQSEKVDAIYDESIPTAWYIYDDVNFNCHKIFIENDQLNSEIIYNRMSNDTVYVYDKGSQSHIKIGTENDIIAIFDHIRCEDHFRYKINKMKEFIHADVNNFRRYLRNLGLCNNYYYVDVSKIDLSNRIRRNNADTKLKSYEFDQDMYMFVFRNDFRGMYDQLIIHVDGIRYHDLQVFKTDMLDYLYIPCNLVKPDTVLEIEKLTPVLKEYKIKSERISDILNVDLGEFAVRNKTLYNDLFIIDESTGEVIDPSLYQIILPVDIHLEDNETNIVLDYILSETDNGYYYIKELENDKIDFVKQENIEDGSNVYYLKAEDENERAVYQFDVDEDGLIFKKTNEYGNIINKLRSAEDKSLVYEFNIVNGIVKINVINADQIPKDDFVGYGGLDLLELGEIFLPCTQNIKIRLIDQSLLNKELTLMVKKNHNIKSFSMDDLADNMTSIQSFGISKGDQRYFRLYRNGLLVPRHLGMVEFANKYTNRYTEMTIYPGFVSEPGDKLVSECMPYMMRQVCYLESIPRDQIIDLSGKIDKPFDFNWYDIYLNGRKLVKKDVEIISANKIRILKSDSLRWLEIIENSRDEEYFGVKPVNDILDRIYESDKVYQDNLNNAVKNDDKLQDIEPPVVPIPVVPLNYLLKEFYEYLVNLFGMINPDELQLTREMIDKFGELSNNKNIFELNPDSIGKKHCPYKLQINPDKK